MRGGLYIHFPFCSSKCPYCHFYSVVTNDAGLRTWRDGLEKEAAASQNDGLRFDTLYLGGGTPSLLGPDEVACVRDLALAHFSLEISEFTLEANPVKHRAGLLRGWREAGVTRLSVGVQSFDDAVLRTLGRPYSAGEALRFCRAARRAGFDALAVDLMTGIPGETAEASGRSLRTLLELQPDHVSLYFLENVEGLPFAEVLALRPIDEDAAVDNYLRTRDALEAAGLRQYEISNFAREGLKCRHNINYWENNPYIGIGASAGGLAAFIPLAFHPDNTRLRHIPPTTGFADLKNIAVARLLLDNIPHIKTYWVMMTPRIAQIAQRFGADDLDGTVVEERIYHDAGATTAQSLDRGELLRLIREAGREPVERDTLYRPVQRAKTTLTVLV
jgi:putative oxygen-independent coproporphyrinogen III oxidase